MAFIANSYSITALLVVLGLVGETSLAAEIGLVQGIMLALFYAFSANSRNIVLNTETEVSINLILFIRVILIFPLSVIAYYVSVYVSDIDVTLSVALIVRRSVEWIGELHLSWRESSSDGNFARKYFLMECFLFLLLVAWHSLKLPMSVIGILIWALLPLTIHIRFIRKMLLITGSLKTMLPSWSLMLPQFGSTMIIGVSVYFFRLIVVLVTGKSEAGDLFTAFALGGIAGSLFAQILGPSIVLYESQTMRNYFTMLLKSFLVSYCVVGVVLFFVAYFNLGLTMMTGKSSIFWSAVGASMVGGTAMVYAQRSRCRLLQTSNKADLFGPDVYINIIVLACVPCFYYILGHQALTVLYLVSATLAYVIYRRTEIEYGRGTINRCGNNQCQIATALIVLSIIVPMFIQIESGLFRESSLIFDSEGVIGRLPIPLSVLGCFIGIIIIGNYWRANMSFGMILFSFIMMLIASLVSTYHQNEATKAKLFFLLQFILPMFALVLGQQYEGLDPKMTQLRRIFLWLLCIVIPLQLLATFMQGQTQLSPYLYLFSIYQHWQYVPVILTTAFIIVLYGCWEHNYYKRIISILFPIMSIYVAASNSTMALMLFITGTAGYLIYNITKGSMDKLLMLLSLIVIVLSCSYIYYFQSGSSSWQKIQVLRSDNIKSKYVSIDVKQSRSITDRIPIWKFYTEQYGKNIRTILWGNAQPPDRNMFKSAHNYYLEFLYNFGILSMVPLMSLIGVTVYTAYKVRRELYTSPELIGFLIGLYFIIFIDNCFKVGLRQPYPAIFTFFIWGILLSKMMNLHHRLST